MAVRGKGRTSGDDFGLWLTDTDITEWGRAAATGRYISAMTNEALARLEALPDVLTIRELAPVLRCSVTTIKRRIRARSFPIPLLGGIDNRKRFAKSAVRRYLDGGGPARLRRG